MKIVENDFRTKLARLSYEKPANYARDNAICSDTRRLAVAARECGRRKARRERARARARARDAIQSGSDKSKRLQGGGRQANGATTSSRPMSKRGSGEQRARSHSRRVVRSLASRPPHRGERARERRPARLLTAAVAAAAAAVVVVVVVVARKRTHFALQTCHARARVAASCPHCGRGICDSGGAACAAFKCAFSKKCIAFRSNRRQF